MGELNKGWVPEIDKECMFKHWVYGWINVKILAKHPRENVYWFEGVSLDYIIEENSNTSTASVGFFRPVNSEAENRQEGRGVQVQNHVTF